MTTEWRRPDGCGACESVAKNSASLGVGPEPSPPRSDKRRTWLAVIPSVTCCDGNECLRVSRGSRHGDNKYGLTGESTSRLSRGVDFVDDGEALASSQLIVVSSTTILQLSCLNDGVKDDRRRRLKCSENERERKRLIQCKCVYKSCDWNSSSVLENPSLCTKDHIKDGSNTKMKAEFYPLLGWWTASRIFHFLGSLQSRRYSTVVKCPKILSRNI